MPPTDFNLFSGTHPNLQSLRLNTCHLPLNFVVVSGHTMTHLHLITHTPRIAVEPFAKVLISLPNLKELELVGSIDNRALSRAQNVPRVALPNLETIKIGEEHPESAFQFVEWFYIPAALVHLSSVEDSDWTTLCSGFNAHQDEIPFDIRFLSIRGDPSEMVILSISSDTLYHRYSMQLKATEVDDAVDCILDMLDLSNVINMTLDAIPLEDIDRMLGQMRNVEVLSVSGDHNDLMQIVVLLSLEDEGFESDDEENEDDDDDLCSFPNLRELTFSKLEDGAHNVLLEILDSRQEIGLGPVKLTVL
ncbi:hypothetical protein BDN72DRAFT_803126, partial [Pluteus cervinus]